MNHTQELGIEKCVGDDNLMCEMKGIASVVGVEGSK
jgi:hypothetical protein